MRGREKENESNALPCHTTLDEKLRIAETHYIGVLTMAEIVERTLELVELKQARGWRRFLSDCRGFTSIDGSLVELRDLAERLSDIATHGRSCEAMILPNLPEAAEIVRVWEMLCRNRGLIVRSFENRDQAVEWLLLGTGAEEAGLGGIVAE